MLMSSGVYRSQSFQERCREAGLRRPASMTAPARSGGARALKRRTVSGGEVMRGPSRIKSMPNMQNSVDIAGRRPIIRRDRADTESTGTRTKCAAVDPSSRKPRTKSSTVRYSAIHGTDTTADDQATPPTTSCSSSVVVDIEATPTSFVGDRTCVPSHPPTPLRPETESPICETSGDVTCLQSPVNSSGVRIVIDSDNDDDNDDDDDDDGDNDDDNDDDDDDNDDDDGDNDDDNDNYDFR